MRNTRSIFLACACSLAFPAQAGVFGPLGGAGLHGEYAQFTDSPFSGLNFSYFYLDNFEDLALNTPGVTADNGSVISMANSSAIDSVDADDGTVDGSGANGASFVAGNSISFSFNGAALGILPTHAGIVFTDDTQGALITFEAFDQNGVSLGSVSATLGDSTFYSTTKDDRFFGAENAGGISRIVISDNSSPNNLEVDHLQYGLSAPVPEPETYALMLAGLGLVGFAARRRRVGK